MIAAVPTCICHLRCLCPQLPEGAGAQRADVASSLHEGPELVNSMMLQPCPANRKLWQSAGVEYAIHLSGAVFGVPVER